MWSFILVDILMLNYHFILQLTNLVIMVICNMLLDSISWPTILFSCTVFFQFLYQGNKNESDSFSSFYIFRYIFYKILLNYS